MAALFFHNYIAHLSEICVKSGASVILTRQSFEGTKFAFYLHGPFKYERFNAAARMGLEKKRMSWNAIFSLKNACTPTRIKQHVDFTDQPKSMLNCTLKTINLQSGTLPDAIEPFHM